MFGSELRCLPDFGPLERAFIRFYGTLSAPTVIRYTRFRYFALAYLDRHGIRPRRILDFGCAFGAFGFALARRDPEAAVFLYDASPAAAERCRTIASRGGYSRVSVLDEGELDRESAFDLILLVAVLEHVEDDRGLLERLREKLAPGGHLFLMVPEASAHHDPEADDYHRHVRPGYSRDELSALVQSAGFEVVAEPEYSPAGGGWLLGRLASAYSFLTRSPRHPLLDFESLPRLPAWKKAGLAVLWPFHRAALEVDAAMAGMREDRLALLVRRSRL